MPKIACPNCGFNPHPDDGPNCTRCNTPLGSSGSAPNGTAFDNEDRNVVGEITLGDDDLGIETASQFAARGNFDSNNSQSQSASFNDNKPSSMNSESNSAVSDNSAMPSKNAKSRTTEDSNETGPIKKLTREEVHKIEEDLYGSVDYVSETDKIRIAKNLSSASPPDSKKGFDGGLIIPPSRKSPDSKPSNMPVLIDEDKKPKPKISDRIDGVAYFANRIIQVTGRQELREGDYISIQERRYVLQKKRVSSNVIFAAAACLAAVLLFWLGAYFTAGSGDSSGTVVGIALDEFNRPVEKHVTIRFPEIDRETKTKSDAFFEIDDLPPGSHKIEFVFGNEVVGEDFVTIVGGEISTISISPNRIAKPSKSISSKPKRQPQASKQTASQSQATIPDNNLASSVKEPQKSSNKSAASSSSSQTKYARLVLAANVEGARLMLDGKVLGAGNLTYRNLKSGRHNYSVSKSGYKTVAGKVTLSSGKSKYLKVTLAPLAPEKISPNVEAGQYSSSGRAAFKEGRLDDAVLDFTKALSVLPSAPSLHMLRAEVHDNLGNKNEAYSDYVRAAEIYQFDGKLTKASTAYSRAIKTDRKVVTAFLGRGSLFLSRNQVIASVADFETVIRLDKRNAAGYLGLGNARFALGNYKKAIKHFKDARSLASSDPVAYHGLMASYLKNNEIKNVGKTYKQFVKNVSAEQVARFRSDRSNSSLIRIIDSL